MNTDDRRDIAARPSVDVGSLRTEPAVITSQADHFCALCACSKSGWATDPNPGCDWCENLDCPCHDEDR